MQLPCSSTVGAIRRWPHRTLGGVMDRVVSSISCFPWSISRLVLLCLLVFSLGGIAQAQSTAVLNGTVTASSGAAAPNAKEIITNVATAVARSTQTDQAGAYLI